MEFRLTVHQKKLLVSLFNNSQIDTSLLFLNIESNLKNIDIPTDANEVVALKEAKLMSDISKTSKKLNQLLTRLNQDSKEKINWVIANPILDQHSLIETDKFYKKSDAIKITERLSKHCDFRNHFIKGRYGKSKWDRVVDAICHSWPIELGTEKKITLEGKRVKFFSIILDEDKGTGSDEKIFKFIKRSQWYKQHFYLDTTWQNNQ
jgi:hypothetical protein